MNPIDAARQALDLRPRLPAWAAWDGDDRIAIDAATAYPVYLRLLEPELKTNEVTQFALEVARRCITTDLKGFVKRRQPKRERMLVLHFRDPAKRWALRHYAPGRGGDLGAMVFDAYWRKLPQTRELAR